MSNEPPINSWDDLDGAEQVAAIRGWWRDREPCSRCGGFGMIDRQFCPRVCPDCQGDGQAVHA